MKILKKSIANQKNLKILNQSPIIFFYQHNNVSTINWHLIKKEFSKMDNIPSLVVQNKKAKKVLSELNLNLKNLFQGPTYIITFKNLNQIENIKNFMQKQSNFIFIGGLFFNQIISYHTLDKITKLNEYTVIELIQILKQQLTSILFLQTGLNHNICNILELCRQKKKKE